MKIAILGYGKMGHEIEKIAVSKNHTIELVVDNETDWLTGIDKLTQCDVAIEFSNPNAVESNIYQCFKANVPIVVGTTGWHDKKASIEAYCMSAKQCMLTASNFSVGVNIFFEINKKLADLMNRFPDYDVSMEEAHHIHKLDSPSGTAITLANDIITKLDRKNQWSETENNQQTIPIHAVREGDIVGTHSVTYQSAVDYIQIKHHAYNRSGFALGAVLAAEYICGKKGVFTFGDIFK